MLDNNKPLLYNQFLLWCQGGHSKETVKSYGYGLYPFIKYIKSINKEITDCTVTDLSTYAIWLENRGLRGSTRQSYLGALRTFWNWLYRQKLVSFNEEMIPIPKDRTDSESYPYLPTRDFISMVNVFNDFSPVELRNKAMLHFLYFTGVRVGEMCSIDVSDIDTQRVNENFQLEPRGEVKTFKRHNHKRFIYWTEETNVLLRRWLDVRQQFLDYHRMNSNALWITMDTANPGERIRKASVERMFRQCRDVLHLDKQYTPHSCRHGFGHNMSEKVVNFRHLQEMMGHKKLSTTQIYMQVENRDVENSYRRAYQPFVPMPA